MAYSRHGLFLHLSCLKFLRNTYPSSYTAWKVFKYGIIFGPYFPAFGQNKEIYSLFSANTGKQRPKQLRIWILFMRRYPHMLTTFCLSLFLVKMQYALSTVHFLAFYCNLQSKGTARGILHIETATYYK